jgi:hypothetical protein
MVVKAVLIFDAKLLIPTVADKAISATTRAYSTMSCPSTCFSNRNNLKQNARIPDFIFSTLFCLIFIGPFWERASGAKLPREGTGVLFVRQIRQISAVVHQPIKL